MKNLRNAAVLLIQPPEPIPPLKAIDAMGGCSIRTGPPWSLLTLRAYLLTRTGHTCSLIDTNLFENVESELTETIEDTGQNTVAVINTSTANLGEASGVIQILHRAFPDMVIVICGEFPSSFPERTFDIPYVDYGLSGDPEPTLRNLMEYCDVPHRAEKIPGLVMKQNPDVEPYWLSDLKGLSLPDWTGIFWPAYHLTGQKGIRMEMRLSRGHSGADRDEAFGEQDQPFREWGMERAASCMQRCSAYGITEVFLDDAPGYWTIERLQRWCNHLITVRSTQNWAFQILPTLFTQDMIADLLDAGCRRVEVIMPSCDPHLLEKLGCLHQLSKIDAMISKMEHAGLTVHLRYWVGGPEEKPKEHERIIRTINSLHFCPYALYPFPLHFDSPLYEELSQTRDDLPILDDSIQWARDPWLGDRPPALWDGISGIELTKRTLNRVQKATHRSTRRKLQQLFHDFHGFDTIAMLEEKALSFLIRKKS